MDRLDQEDCGVGRLRRPVPSSSRSGAGSRRGPDPPRPAPGVRGSPARFGAVALGSFDAMTT